MVDYWLVNTNRSYVPEWKSFMLASRCVCAAYEGSKEQIDQLKAGDTVFLYHNGVGIIAYGKTDGLLKITPFRGERGEQHSMKVDRWREIDPPIAAAEISEASQKQAGANIYYARTVVPLRFEVGNALHKLAVSRQR